MFGSVSVVAGGGCSNSGRPRLPYRLMVALLFLTHAFNQSDEDVIQNWGETLKWQYFSDNEYFYHQWSCDPTQLGRFRQALGEDVIEEILARTMELAVTLKLIAKKELTRVIEDSTVQKQAMAHPTESKLLETSRFKVVDNRAKLYSWHASEVECISKGKGRKSYEFGVKVGLTIMLKGNLIVGARSFPGNPYDGHTMHEQNDCQESLGPFVVSVTGEKFDGIV